MSFRKVIGTAIMTAAMAMPFAAYHENPTQKLIRLVDTYKAELRGGYQSKYGYVFVRKKTQPGTRFEVELRDGYDIMIASAFPRTTDFKLTKTQAFKIEEQFLFGVGYAFTRLYDVESGKGACVAFDAEGWKGEDPEVVADRSRRAVERGMNDCENRFNDDIERLNMAIEEYIEKQALSR